MANGSEKYQADRGNNQEESSESGKKTAKVAAKAAADYFTGGKGGAVVDKLADTKLGQQVLNQAGKVIDKNPLTNKAAQKLNNSGALDAADKGLSMVESGGAASGTGNVSNQGEGIKSLSSGSKSSSSDNKGGGVSGPDFKNLFGQKKNKFANDSLIDENEDVDDYSASSQLFATGSSIGKQIWGKLSLKTKLIIIVVIFVLFLLFSFIIIIINELENNSFNVDNNTVCSKISMKRTKLSEEEFTELLSQKQNSGTGYRIFYENASTIYNLSVNNNINPEMVVIRAVREGFDPGGSSNNYWGLGCTNTGGRKACINYSSFSQGVLGYINNISKYDTIEDMMSKYSYIGDYWYSPGGSGKGGCYYYPYIKQYLSSSRSSEVGNACSSSCSGSSCLKTIEEDQQAYTSWQVSKMVETRKDVFNLDEEECETVVDGGSGSEIVQYAIDTFDSFSYSQANRMSSFAVDCSSLVWRTYNHFNINFGVESYAPTAQVEYNWCQSNGREISESELQPGDLIFWYHGTSTIQHVAIYVGNNQQFAAHSSRYAQPDQVSVSAYNNGSGDRFCRPY